MAPAKTKSTASEKTSSTKSSRTRRRSQTANPDDGKLLTIVKDAQRRRWRPLDNLVELDWDKYIRWTVSKPIVLKQGSSIHISDHDYEISLSDLFLEKHDALQLNTGDHFLIVPIKEPEAMFARRRNVLVREKEPFGKGQLILVYAEPPDENAPHEQFYVIGDDSAEIKSQEPHVIGAVEAVLTVNDPPPMWTVSQPIPATSSIPASATVIEQPSVAPYDEDLLKRLDVLNIIKECCDQAGEDVRALQRTLDEGLLKRLNALNIIKERCTQASENAAAMQRAFNELVGQRYGLKVIPVNVNRSRYDEGLGHLLDNKSHYTFVGEEIITGIRRTGYTRDGEVVRKANVIVNRHTTQFVQLTSVAFSTVDTLQVEMSAPADCTLGEVMREAAVQIDALDALYDWIHIFASGSPVQIKDLARRLVKAKFTRDNPRDILKEANSRHLQMSSLAPGPYMMLTLSGETRSLTRLRDILYIEAIGRMNKSYCPRPQRGWIFQEIRTLQRFLPKGIDEARFTKDSSEILHEIMARISFARDFKFPKANS